MMKAVFNAQCAQNPTGNKKYFLLLNFSFGLLLAWPEIDAFCSSPTGNFLKVAVKKNYKSEVQT